MAEITYKDMERYFSVINESIEKMEEAIERQSLYDFANSYYIYSSNFALYSSYIGCFYDKEDQMKKLHNKEEQVINKFYKIRNILHNYKIVPN